ncbi:ubiquitin carboxyl-terminal hydrolase 37-like [Salvelinus fontinalis]|uniref:ubiquitin carboxyl-terminal hydrolase 37-like n=1 Tax=Salvelinus fontinalis TaxID=8038 RepID=UPI002485EF69|nr:ubiquitin carboxyl-terminal hydrolase 37-like [Salvelinus fontinalis]XP_055734959.1 ubiquitin carboxyl-terminal hydrolase 37-like [Salvelinus fontinalis]XP_055734960.1 ubiquitin carboxyl-terminal hydrolase 37-like [Salvelinus fontinalis]
MAVAVPKLSSGAVVKIRYNSIDVGTTRWKEGTFEVLEKDNKVNLWLKFSAGGAAKSFQLNHNVNNVVMQPIHTMRRIVVTLKDDSIVTLERVPPVVAEKMKEYLEKLKHGKSTVLKTSQGSASFGVLGNRSVKNETSPPGERQTTPRRPIVDNREETTTRKHLGSPSRVTSTPARSGLSENRNEKRKRLHIFDCDLTEDYPKENDSSSNNKATPDPSRKFLLSCKDKLKQAEENRSSVSLVQSQFQPTSFYGSRSATKDYASHSFLDRPSTTSRTPSAKRSLMLPNHSTPLKKVRPTLDYGGWNKPRPSTLAQPQPPLQGFSNLGNTCYMNVILQSLFSLPSFSNDLLKQGIPWKKVPANALLRRFAHLLAKKDISCPEVKKDLLRRVKSAISSTAERFSGYMQNDAHEFLSQCLDQLKEDVEKVNKSWKSESPAAAWDEPPQQAAAARPGEEVDTSRIYTCPVVVNMEFEVQHTITCKDCGEVVNKREQFNDLSIDLPRRKKTIPLRSIQDSLDLFFRIEEIEYSCEKCSGKVATVTHKFSRLPRVLILHLKRYSFNAQLSLNSKLGQQVMIPRYLTLLSHCTDATRPPLSLGWSANAAMPRTLKASQSVNSSSLLRKVSLKAGGSSSTVLVDSDSEEELSRKVVSRKRRLSDCLPDDRADEVQRAVHHPDASDFNRISDEEMLAAVLEMSRHDAGLSCHAPEDEPTSSPDTGFGDADAQEMNYRPDPLETDTKPSADVLDSLDLTMDENKENQTPEGVQGDLDWVQQYGLEQEREEQELQLALAQSLQEHEAQEMREDDDLKKATELSLQEFNNLLPELLCSDEDSGNEEVLDMEYSEAETEDLKRNAESGDLANSFRLISVVSHIGSSSSSGHYISDVYDMKKQSWLTYNDLDVSRTQEASVQRDRDRSGYIFFYMHKDVFEELSELERTGASGGASEAGRTVLQPL